MEMLKNKVDKGIWMCVIFAIYYVLCNIQASKIQYSFKKIIVNFSEYSGSVLI